MSKKHHQKVADRDVESLKVVDLAFIAYVEDELSVFRLVYSVMLLLCHLASVG